MVQLIKSFIYAVEIDIDRSIALNANGFPLVATALTKSKVAIIRMTTDWTPDGKDEELCNYREFLWERKPAQTFNIHSQV